MSMSGKNTSRNSQAVRGGEDLDGNTKPLSSAILQEFQNLKDKFKNEDEGYEKGIVSPKLLFKQEYFNSFCRIAISASRKGHGVARIANFS